MKETMSVNLSKGQKVNLSKEHPGLSEVVVGLGWEAADKNGSDSKPKKGLFSMLSSALFGEVRSIPSDQTIDCDSSVVDLNQLPQDYNRLVIIVNIYRAREKKQHFGKVRNAYVRLVNNKNGQELYRYNLTENYDGYTAMIFSELYRHNREWKFSAIGQGTNDGSIAELARRYS